MFQGPMNSDSAREYDFKFDPVKEMDPVWFPYRPATHPSVNKPPIGFSASIAPFKTHLPGTLSLLPLELVWNIFDEILYGGETNTLQHDAFHAIHNLSQVDRLANQTVNNYIARRAPQHMLRLGVGDIDTHPYQDDDPNYIGYENIQLDYPIPMPITDLLTGVIRDDCPTCFAYVLDYLAIDIGYCNQEGWSFVAIAVAYESIEILKYIRANPSPYLTLPNLLLGPGNFQFPRPTPLDLLGVSGNRRLLERFLDLAEGRLSNLDIPTLINDAFYAPSLLLLCAFLSPSQARRLEVDVWITSFHDEISESIPWHGAAGTTQYF
ncbi:uncharacterized protein N7482_001158 [Penicillium canariense]|uniref:Uncharacterized protein n=1 Tax=Penicillium canariense TaxID=189055 RepID=A0A9W9LSU0_9EURO|nr:uncharacterized protein N7482_001158 [Penicillium canariense]KAJ5175281.1 hypothetical protein N7482_001158 [Penicillium canariense]